MHPRLGEDPLEIFAKAGMEGCARHPLRDPHVSVLGVPRGTDPSTGIVVGKRAAVIE